MSSIILCADVLHIPLPDQSVSLTVTSPPYESQRSYAELGFNLQGQDWVDWCVAAFKECLRVTNGLVVFVVAGKTRKFKWSATPALLMADLHRSGVNLRNPLIYHRVGIPGSGGPDWFRSDYEFIICATNNAGRLPWSDNKAMGSPPKYKVGGELSYRTQDGSRVNRREQARIAGVTGKTTTSGSVNGDIVTINSYLAPEIANPGNVLKLSVGGGKLGHPMAHSNEAPFHLDLPAFFIKSCCRPGDIVCDPMCGSSSTGHAAIINGRRYIGMDIRESQCELSRRRLDTLEAKAA